MLKRYLDLKLYGQEKFADKRSPSSPKGLRMKIFGLIIQSPPLHSRDLACPLVTGGKLLFSDSLSFHILVDLWLFVHNNQVNVRHKSQVSVQHKNQVIVRHKSQVGGRHDKKE